VPESSAGILEDEGIVHSPNYVKSPRLPVEREEYPTRTIGEDVNPTLVIFGRDAFERGPISGRRCGQIPVEVGVLREREALLALEMAEVPKDFW